MLLAQLAVAGAAVMFGTTFIVVQGALAGAAPIPFVAVRFLIAAALVFPLTVRRRRVPGAWAAGVAAGIPLLAGYLLQTIGLRYVTTSVSAFITDLLVVIVPVLSAVVWRSLPKLGTWIGAGLAVAGLFLLTGASLTLGYGQLLTVGCAVAFATNVVVLAKVAPHHDPVHLTAVQLLVVGAGSAVPGLFTGGYHLSVDAVWAAVYTAVAASAVAFFLQTWGQRRLSPARTALLLMIEPITAAIVGALTGQRLGAIAAVGAALILVGLAVSELWPERAHGDAGDLDRGTEARRS
ncbi:MAG: DMT family transporter [Acidimicrobiales bacterium]